MKEHQMSDFVIRNGRIVTPTGVVERGWVSVEGGVIVGVGEGEQEDGDSGQVRDAEGGWVLPGLIDIHCHGGGGRSFQEASVEAVEEALRAHETGGTRAMLPAVAACPQDERHACLEAIGEAKQRNATEVEVLGAYIEGPYFSEKERGAQPLDLIGAPTADDYMPTLERFGDLVKVWALAPELPGAAGFIRELVGRGIVAALGHSDASEEHVEEAVEAGASLVTHHYCAQSTFHRVEAEKALGLAEMALLMDELTVELIADGKHLPERLLRLILKNKPPQQACLITDAMPAAGLEPGEYEFLGDTVWVTEEVAYRADRQRYAGSVLTMERAVRTAERLGGATMEELAAMASLTPARLLGVDDRKGSIEVGKDGDVVVIGG